MVRGEVPAELMLGLERVEPAGALHDTHHGHGDDDGDGDDHEHGDAHSQDHNHDHSHVPMQSLALKLPGHFDRQALERLLIEQIVEQGILRLKGWLHQSGKPRPLQIQAVGPRLDCWYDRQPVEPSAAENPGLELVVLGLRLDKARLEQVLGSAALSPLA
jgi:cobalamin biosynthesis protein CobW